MEKVPEQTIVESLASDERRLPIVLRPNRWPAFFKVLLYVASVPLVAVFYLRVVFPQLSPKTGGKASFLPADFSWGDFVRLETYFFDVNSWQLPVVLIISVFLCRA